MCWALDVPITAVTVVQSLVIHRCDIRVLKQGMRATTADATCRQAVTVKLSFDFSVVDGQT